MATKPTIGDVYEFTAGNKLAYLQHVANYAPYGNVIRAFRELHDERQVIVDLVLAGQTFLVTMVRLPMEIREGRLQKIGSGPIPEQYAGALTFRVPVIVSGGQRAWRLRINDVDTHTILREPMLKEQRLIPTVSVMNVPRLSERILAENHIVDDDTGVPEEAPYDLILYAYFSDRDSAEKFASWARQFNLENEISILPGEDDDKTLALPVSVKLGLRPQYAEECLPKIQRALRSIEAQARELGGEYDGLEVRALGLRP